MSASEYPIINNYLFFKETGTDCIGVDYRAGEIDWTTRKPVKPNLVTEVYPFLAKNPNVWKRINILLEGVKKSNIPKLYSPEKIIHEEEHSYIVYPLINGKSFEQVLDDSFEKDNPINFDLAFSIAFSIADLIDVGSSIVVSGEKSFHGFLTPDNIIIDYDGKIYLKNYGIYPYLSKEEDIFNEMVKKYGAWIAPEFMRKEKLVCQTDIYHLGYIIYKILTGKYFSCTPEEDFDAKFSNISFTQHIPSSDKNFLTDIIWFFKKTLHPQPSQRFANIKEFKDFISNKFHIEELSSVTFNLSYYMNTLYLDSMEAANEVMAKEMSYIIPEEKKVEKKAVAEGKSGDHLVQDILSGLDEHEKKAGNKLKFIIPLLAVILIVIGVSAYLYINQQNQVKEQEQQRIKAAEQLKKDMDARLEILNKDYQAKLKDIEAKAATTEEEKQAQLDEINKLRDWQKDETKKALEVKKADEERLLKNQTDLENQRKLDAEQEQERLLAEKKIEEEKKLEQAKQDALKKEEEKNRIKPGQLIALSEVTKKPEKLKGKEPSFNPMLRKKYVGNKWKIQVMLLVMENGTVGNVRILTSTTPEDVRESIINALGNWQYEPAQKGDIKVKVWLPVALSISF